MTSRQRDNWIAHTDIGRVRTHNEDAVLAQPPLFAVADGLGGHEAGEVASTISIETLRDNAPKRPDTKALARAVRAANAEVLRASREGVGRQGMGTTLTAAIVEGTTIAIAHVGDSRAYLLHEGRLQQLTADHSMVAEMIRRGELSEAESRVHPNRSVITRALGTDANMEVDTYEIEAAPGDRLLLCSDGLSGMLVDSRIEGLLGKYADLDVTAKALIQAANDEGGQDNISVVIAEIEGARFAARRDRASLSRAWLPVAAWVLAFILVVAAIIGAVRYYAWQSYYLAEDAGYVAIYRGVPGEIAGLGLHWQIDLTDTAVSDLPAGLQQRLADGVSAENAEQALALARTYDALAGGSTAPTSPVSPDPTTGP